MDVDELIERAWSAVTNAGVSEVAQPTALKEAVDFLRAEEGSDANRKTIRRKPSEGRKRQSSSNGSQASSEAPPDEDTFFGSLARESGVDESDLRDVLQLGADGTVMIGPPTRQLGSSIARQAQTAIALVAGARSMGLSENPVRAEAVRTELQRKRCYNQPNFAAKHLGPLKGFNAGATRAEIKATSKAPEDFRAAVEQVLGRTPNDG